MLYYARAIEGTMIPGLNSIGVHQAQSTEVTRQELQQLMDYAATYPNVNLRLYASDVILIIDSDSAYLILPRARSRIAGYFRLEDRHS